MVKLDTYINEVKVIVFEASGASTPVMSDESYASFVRRALRRYSIDRPKEKVSSVTGAGTRYITVNATNFPGFIDGWSVVKRIEAFKPTVADDEYPNYIEPDEWDFYRDDSTYYVHFVNQCPSTSDASLFTYTIPHTIDGLDSETTDTIPAVDIEAVHHWAANEAFRTLAGKFAGTQDPNLRADVVNYKTKSADFLRLSEEHRKAYQAWIANPETAAFATRDLDFGLGYGDGQPYETHRSYSRA